MKVKIVDENYKPHIETMSNEDYHKAPGISKTQLDYVAQSPGQLVWNDNYSLPEKENKTGDLGDIFHSLAIEPKRLFEEYAVAPKLDLRTNKGKELLKKFKLSLGSKKLITADERDMLSDMINSLLYHPTWQKYKKRITHVEKSIFWRDDKTGILCKARPDCVLSGDHIEVDVKTTKAISKCLKNDFEDYRYHVQAAHYMAGYKALYGVFPRFLFAVVSKSKTFGRHRVAIKELDDQFIIEGRNLRRENLDLIAYSNKYDDWCGIEILHYGKGDE